MPQFFADIPLSERVRRLIYGRLALIFLLFLASWWWTNNYLQLSVDFFPVQLFLLFALSLFLTVVYLLVLHFDDNFLWQIRIQILIDILLITALVWGTGDLISPYVTLYVVLITAAGFFLSNRETIFIAVLCSICFTLIPVLTSQNFIFSLSDTQNPSHSVQVIAFNTVAILIVGLLAGRFSERRRITEQLQQTTESFADLHILHERIVESIRSGLITTDLGGKIYDFNPAAEQIVRIPHKEVLGESVYSLFGPEIKPRVEACLKNVGEPDLTAEPFESVLEINEDCSRIVSGSVAPLIGKNGDAYGLIFAFQDITEIREMEESLRRSDRLAAVGRMAAGLAHEIRNPLGSMGSALQFLQEKLPPESSESSLMEVVLRESERLNDIITNFLAYARPSANVFSDHETGEVDVDRLIRDCLVLLRHSPDIKEIHDLDYLAPKTSPVIIKANETQLKQVFWNLARNSVQAMPDGGRLLIRLRPVGKDKIQIVFEDTGNGIGPDKLEHIFEPFSGHNNGSGLGLSIVHNIISDHRGTINVQSNVGKGTKIVVELPV